MTSIGDTLRRERLRRGWDLEHVAAETKITTHLLEAIEADQFDRVPGGVFARNFVRQYARMLKLDDDEIIAAFRQQFEEPAEPVPEPQPSPVASFHLPPLEDFRQRLGPGSSLSAFLWLVVVILACAGVYGLWQKTRRMAAAAPTVTTAPKIAPASAPSAASKQEFRPAEVSETGTIRVPQSSALKPVAVIPAAANEHPVSAEAAVRVALTASEPVWVSIKSDGTHVYSGTLEGRQSREFDASRKITLLVGNAGSLEVSLNGKPIGPVGPRGEIRLLNLTPKGAYVMPRTPPTPPSGDSSAPPAPAPATIDRP
jgi:cytoskeleton protein RodZ